MDHTLNKEHFIILRVFLEINPHFLLVHLARIAIRQIFYRVTGNVSEVPQFSYQW